MTLFRFKNFAMNGYEALLNRFLANQPKFINKLKNSPL